MFSRLTLRSSFAKNCLPTKSNNAGQFKPNSISKRFSGHNTMDIVPSSFEYKYANNWEHFYFFLGAIPLSIITAIANIRANPELTEVPEGYEPRHWEYFKSPISRWIAKYILDTQEKEYEMFMSMFDLRAEDKILSKVTKNTEAVMRFYNDHRSIFFRPYFAEYFRYGRERHHLWTADGESDHNIGGYDPAFDKNVKAVPYKGYVDPKDRP